MSDHTAPHKHFGDIGYSTVGQGPQCWSFMGAR